MKNTTILILCAGEATRWNNYLGVPKQLISINGESLLQRTIRLLHSKKLYDINIVSNDDRLELNSCNLFRPSKYQWVVETLLSTQTLWNQNTLILLGDIFYTQEAINTIVSLKENTHIYGRDSASIYTKTAWGEIFALSFTQGNWPQIITHAKSACRQARLGGRGKLWDFYRSLAGSPLNEHHIENKIFVPIHDFTDDFDLPSEYDANIKRYEYLTSTKLYKRSLLYAWVAYIKIIHCLKNNLRPLKSLFQKNI